MTILHVKVRLAVVCGNPRSRGASFEKIGFQNAPLEIAPKQPLIPGIFAAGIPVAFAEVLPRVFTAADASKVHALIATRSTLPDGKVDKGVLLIISSWHLQLLQEMELNQLRVFDRSEYLALAEIIEIIRISTLIHDTVLEKSFSLEEGIIARKMYRSNSEGSKVCAAFVQMLFICICIYRDVSHA